MSVYYPIILTAVYRLIYSFMAWNIFYKKFTSKVVENFVLTKTMQSHTPYFNMIQHKLNYLVM